jgi:hypothetical protein
MIGSTFMCCQSSFFPDVLSVMLFPSEFAANFFSFQHVLPIMFFPHSTFWGENMISSTFWEKNMIESTFWKKT